MYCEESSNFKLQVEYGSQESVKGRLAKSEEGQVTNCFSLTHSLWVQSIDDFLKVECNFFTDKNVSLFRLDSLDTLFPPLKNKSIFIPIHEDTKKPPAVRGEGKLHIRIRSWIYKNKRAKVKCPVLHESFIIHFANCT